MLLRRLVPLRITGRNLFLETRVSERTALSCSNLRRYASSSSSEPVDLAFEQAEPPSPSGSATDGALVICHGLFGSKQNWRSLMKTFAKSINKRVYALDLRNHGTSPHSPVMDYATMAADVQHFMSSQRLSNVSLLGHSLGGKVVMAAALSPSLPADMLGKLIVADMSPAVGPISDEFRRYIDGMLEIEEKGVTTKKDADAILARYEESLPVRHFLLTNLVLSPHKSAHFRVPVSIIRDSIDGIGDFPYPPGERKWEGKVLFVKGAQSKYINRKNIPIAEKYFPNMRMETLDAGHWVHSERPHEFVKVVSEFINSS